MIRIDPDEQTRNFAGESLAVGDPTGWFERLYAAAETGEAVVPWDRGTPHSLLVDWAEGRALDGYGKRAVVVGSGLGEDAEYVARGGFATVAFDISPTAVDAARRRFPDSPVRYLVADLLDLPVRWRGAFDLVVEIFTVQALPPGYRRQATHNVGSLVSPRGTLLVIAAAHDADDGEEGPPWPLTRRAGSMVVTHSLNVARERLERTGIHYDDEYDEAAPPNAGSDRTLRLVDFVIRPHLNAEWFPNATLVSMERAAAKVNVPLYAFDDETAIKVVDGSIEVVSEGEWKLFDTAQRS